MRDKANRPSFTLEVAKEFYDGPDSKHRAKAVKQLKGKTNRTPGFDSPGASTIATKKRDEVVLWKWVMRKLDVSPEQVQDFGACRIPSERGLNASTRRQVARALRAAAHALEASTVSPVPFRLRRKSVSTGLLSPMPGKRFSLQELGALETWAKGLDGVARAYVEGNSVMVRVREGDIEEFFPKETSRKEQKAAEERAIREAQETTRRTADADLLKTSPAAAWAKTIFGDNFANQHNQAALARFLEGDDEKFQGLVGHTWQDGFLRLGYTEEQLRGMRVPELMDLLKKAYAQQRKTGLVTARSWAAAHPNLVHRARLASASSDDIQEGDTVRFLKDTTRKNGIVLKSGEIGRVVSPVSATSFMLQIKGWREKFKMKTSDLGTVVEKINAVTEASATVSAAARNEIAYLKKYLSLSDEDKARDLAYNSPTSLREWADNTGIELVADPEEDPETAINGLSRLERRHWLEWISNYLMRYDPVMAPAYLTLSFERFFRNEWLVHFTDHGHDVVDEGFTRGVDDMAEIALTRLIRDNAKTRPGYVFAFMADDVPRDGAEKYGSQVVLFQGTGVLAYHSGDEESQAIVWGKSAYNLTLLEKNVYEDTWYVAGKYGDSVYTSRKDGHEGLKEVIAWVQNNRNQYRRLLRAGG